MLNNELPTAKQGKLANYKEYNETELNIEQDLQVAIEAMEQEAGNYKRAGLTQVSNWLE